MRDSPTKKVLSTEEEGPHTESAEYHVTQFLSKIETVSTTMFKIVRNLYQYTDGWIVTT